MKKILICFMLISLIACEKHPTMIPETEMVTLTFNECLVSSNSMTRGINPYLDVIQEDSPDYVIVNLRNLNTNVVYKCTSVENITIPIGDYEITAFSIEGTCNNTPCGTYYTKPFLKMDKTPIAISGVTKKINLNLYYNCYAVFALVDECAECNIDNKTDDFFIGYFVNDAHITITPHNTNEYLTTEFVFTTLENAEGIMAEYGKYYIIHPKTPDATDGAFDVEIPEMTNGMI